MFPWQETVVFLFPNSDLNISFPLFSLPQGMLPVVFDND
ncbi:hypothetical protein D082_23430 [Synechocystis sp. PCC 6714]|nr:hypothetical protein D082_23430 [Synechocystis sp. PCC 6714]